MTTTITTAAAALQAGVTVATIRNWCRNGVVAATKRAGRWVIDTTSLTHRIAIAAMRTRKAPAVTEQYPWDDDHPERADLMKLVAAGITPEQIIAALGSDAKGMGRYRPFNGRSLRWVEARLTDIAVRADEIADAQEAAHQQNLATTRQVDYILSLLATRHRDGDASGFYRGPTDRAGIERMTRSEASTYIDSLKGEY